MSQYKDVAVGSTVYFWFAANTTAGAAGDGATPLYDVRLAGAAANAAPTASGTPTLLSHADYTDGLHEIAINTTGYTEGAEYAVFCTLTISTVNPAGFVGSFKVRAASSTLYEQVTEILTRLPDATAGANGGLTICGSNAATTFATLSVTGQLDAGNILVDGTTVLTGNVTISGTTTLTGAVQLGSTLGITGAVTLSSTLATGAVTLSALTVTNNLLVSGTTTHTGAVTLTGGIVANAITGTLSTLTTYTGNTPQTGDSYAIINGAHGCVAIKDLLDTVDTATATNIPNTLIAITGAGFDTATDSLMAIRDKLPTNLEDMAITDTTGLVTMGHAETGSIDSSSFAAGAINGAALHADVVADLFSTTTIAEAYAADAAAGTPAQLLYMIYGAVSEFAIAGTTLTVKKLDGSTTAMTYTLDSATDPTSRTRAS